MKHIFISYGHDKYAHFADELYDWLSNIDNGKRFKVHKDTKGAIRNAMNWDSELEEKIKSSQYIIYLMTEHSTDENSVCRDEIAFARNEGGAKIIPVRMANITPPLLVARLQWIDWLEHIENKEMVFNRILCAIDDYDSIIETNGQGELYKNLYKSDLSFDRCNLIGREDVIEQVSEFVKGDKVGPLVIKGVAGSGKSAIAAKLAQNISVVRSIHQCQFGDADTKSAANVLCNLAYYLSCVDNDYAASVAVEDFEKIGQWTTEELFKHLFINHLGGEKEKYALVVDGVDEMDFTEAEKLLEAVSKLSGNLPNVKFIFTMRDEIRFKYLIEDMLILKLTDEMNRKAAEAMLKAELKKRNIEESILGRILDASEGNFLYITLLLKGHDNNKFNISENLNFPRGLNNLYNAFMKRYFTDSEKFESEYAPLLSIFCVIRRPVTADELSVLTGQKIKAVLRAVKELTFTVKKDYGRYSLFHRSMYDYLTSDPENEFFVDDKEGDKTILNNAAELSVEKIRNDSYLRDFVFAHIFRQKDSAFAQMLYTYGLSDEWAYDCAAKSFQALSSREHADFRETVENMEKGMYLSWRIYMRLDRNRAAGAVIDLGKCLQKSNKLKFHGFIFEGNGLLSSDKISAAKAAYKEAAEIAEKDKTVSQSYENLRNLFVVYSKLGDIAKKEDNAKEAKKYYYEALEIDRQNAEDFPSYESRRDLSVSLNRMGDIADKEDNIQEAKKYYSEALEIDRQNAEDFPSYESRRDLSLSLGRMGDIADKEDNIQEAKKYYSEYLEIARQNAEDFPSYESRRDLSVSLNKMGDIAVKEDNIQEAKKYYSEDLEIARQNAEDFPSYESRRDLSLSLGRMGDIAVKEDNIQEAKKYYSDCLEIFRQNAEDLPSYESRRDLSVSLNRMGDIAKKEDDAIGAKKYYSESLEIARQNAKDFPSYQTFCDLAKSCALNALAEKADENYDRAKELFEEALVYAEKCRRIFPCRESIGLCEAIKELKTDE